MRTAFLVASATLGFSIAALSLASPVNGGDCVALASDHGCCEEHVLPFEVCWDWACESDILLSMPVYEKSYNQNDGWQPSTQFSTPDTYCMFTITTCGDPYECDFVRNDEYTCETLWEPYPADCD